MTIALTVGALLLPLAACGGGDDPADDATLVSDESPSTSTTAGADPAAGTIALGASVHYAGFVLALEEVTVADGTATVVGTAENLGATSASAPRTVVLELPEGEVALDDLRSEIPDVPGGGTGELAYAFRLPEGTTIDDAVLHIGGVGYARASVPFGSSEDLVANEPVAVAVSGEVVAGETTFTFDGGELRLDVPADHEAAEVGKAFLTLRFALTNRSDFAGGYAFGGEDLRLETPSGIALAPDEFPIELLQPRSSLTDLEARWVIDADEPGTYTFVGLRNVGLPTEAEGRLEVVVPPLG